MTMPKSRSEVMAELAEKHAAREKARDDLCRALVAIDATTDRIDVLLLRLTEEGG